MALPTLADVKLVIDHLLTAQKNSLFKLTSAPLYVKRLEQLQKEIASLPPALVDTRPLKQQLAQVDDEHDGYGAALWFLAQAYLRLPGAPPEATAAARAITEHLVSQLGELQDSYADEAARASERRPLLAKHATLLAAIPVAGTAGTTALTVATSYLDRGEQLALLLGERAGQTTGNDRSQAGVLRGKALGLLNRLRAAVADELESDHDLPRDLETTLFAFADQTFGQRAASRAGQGKAAPAGEGTKPGGEATKPGT